MDVLRRDWWVFLMRGLFALIFGILVLVWPKASVGVIVTVFAIYVLIDGVTALAYAFTPSAPHRPALAFEGIIGVVVGFVALRAPGLTALALYGYVAFWAIFFGVGEVVLAVRMRRTMENELLLFLAGLASIVLGVLMLVLPRAGMLALVWLIGVYALLAAVLLIAFSLRLRRFGQRTITTPLPPSPTIPVPQH